MLKIGKKRGTKKEKKQVVHSRPSKKTEQQKAKHRIIIVIMTIDSKKRRRRLRKTSDVVMAIKRNETSDLGGDAFPFFLSLSQPTVNENKQTINVLPASLFRRSIESIISQSCSTSCNCHIRRRRWYREGASDATFVHEERRPNKRMTNAGLC